MTVDPTGRHRPDVRVPRSADWAYGRRVECPLCKRYLRVNITGKLHKHKCQSVVGR